MPNQYVLNHSKYLLWTLFGLTIIYLVTNLVAAKHYISPMTSFNKLVETGKIDNIISVIFILNATALLALMYRSMRDIEVRKGPQKITSAGAVYWWFVPIAFFWKPYEAVKIIVDDANCTEFLGHELQFWWASWIAATISSFILPEISQALEGTGYSRATIAAMYGLEALNAWYFIRLLLALGGGKYE